jgi:hypothetical protein
LSRLLWFQKQILLEAQFHKNKKNKDFADLVRKSSPKMGRIRQKFIPDADPGSATLTLT